MISSFSSIESVYAWTLILATIIYAVSKFFLTILRFVRRNRCIRDIEGPVGSASWLYGNRLEILLSKPYGNYESRWREQYGSTYRVKGRFSENLLFTSDPTTVRYMFNDAKLIDLSPSRTYAAVIILGKESIGVLRSGGEAHRRIKSSFSAAFTPARLQQYVPVMREVARKAADNLMELYLQKSRESDDPNPKLDVYPLLQHAASDIIGEGNILGANRSKISILGDSVLPHIPRFMSELMLHLPTRTFRTLLKFRTITEAWATALLRDSFHSHDNNETDTGLVGFVGAGQETSANATTWALFELAKRPGWQDQIRKELNNSRQNMDSRLDKFECLNAHIKVTSY
ncbi:cytochrome P450 [Marasmius fiardii PR-910]|nr:cytochrome P450 [Marasmius fiardii PR-910]